MFAEQFLVILFILFQNIHFKRFFMLVKTKKSDNNLKDILNQLRAHATFFQTCLISK